MSFADVAFRVIAIAAIVSWIWRFVRTEHGRKRNRRFHTLPRRDGFQHCERSPYWSGDLWRR